MADYPRHPDREEARLDMSISQVWAAERISCPHRDILRAYLAGGLEAAAQDYVAFHLEVIRCPFCLANLEDLDAATSAEKEELRQRLGRAADRTVSSSAVFLERLRDSGAGG
ncbi:MAG: hypothetical protein JXQ29_16035 [Planctomycetes bacterium]|nr:hypothetical protein [Planctomycetota bacterium]